MFQYEIHNVWGDDLTNGGGEMVWGHPAVGKCSRENNDECTSSSTGVYAPGFGYQLGFIYKSYLWWSREISDPSIILCVVDHFYQELAVLLPCVWARPSFLKWIKPICWVIHFFFSHYIWISLLEMSKGHFHFGLRKGHLLLTFLFPSSCVDEEEEKKEHASSFWLVSLWIHYFLTVPAGLQTLIVSVNMVKKAFWI